MHASNRLANELSSTHSISRQRPFEEGERSTTAAPAPSESIQRRNSVSKPRQFPRNFACASNREDLNILLANSLAQTTALFLPPLNTCSMPERSAITPLAQMPWKVAISQ